jgi:predicted nucleic acid-binding protein
MTSNKIFVDTSWFKALMDGNDDFYHDSVLQMKKILKERTLLITTNFIIDETLTLIRVKTDLKTALEFREKIFEMSEILKIARVLDLDEKAAWEWFPKDWKHLSFTDCTSFAVMKRLELTEVTTFDSHFAKAGFKVFT